MSRSRIQQEKQVVSSMIRIYCRGRRHPDPLCPECTELLEYAHKRLDRCRFGENKTFCEQCPVHCYKKDMRERIRQVMRYAGPRTIWHHPIMTIRHLLRR